MFLNNIPNLDLGHLQIAETELPTSSSAQSALNEEVTSPAPVLPASKILKNRRQNVFYWSGITRFVTSSPNTVL